MDPMICNGWRSGWNGMFLEGMRGLGTRIRYRRAPWQALFD